MKRSSILLILAALLMPAKAQDTGDVFTDAPDNAKQHIASGFICSLKVGDFERDAVGQRDPGAKADYCAYSALDGVYGTVTLIPLPRTYDPKALLAPDFAMQEGSAARMKSETIETLNLKTATLPVYMRTYETARLASLTYETLYASAAVGAWVVEVEVEYAAPRDKEKCDAFLQAAYDAAIREIGAQPIIE